MLNKKHGAGSHWVEKQTSENDMRNLELMHDIAVAFLLVVIFFGSTFWLPVFIEMVK